MDDRLKFMPAPPPTTGAPGSSPGAHPVARRRHEGEESTVFEKMKRLNWRAKAKMRISMIQQSATKGFIDTFKIRARVADEEMDEWLLRRIVLKNYSGTRSHDAAGEGGLPRTRASAEHMVRSNTRLHTLKQFASMDAAAARQYGRAGAGGRGRGGDDVFWGELSFLDRVGVRLDGVRLDQGSRVYKSVYCNLLILRGETKG